MEKLNKTPVVDEMGQLDYVLLAYADLCNGLLLGCWGLMTCLFPILSPGREPGPLLTSLPRPTEPVQYQTPLKQQKSTHR